MTFAEKLVELREAAGMTQTALANAARVPLPSLRKYEQGATTKVPFTAVVKLAAALGTDCSTFTACTDVKDDTPKKGQKK